MDGASKFVKGDAIASLLIIVINIIGGFAVGFMRGEGDAMQILATYAMLSVGEGLVSQIPALLISTASGLLVTRNGQESGMGGTMFGQLLGQPKVLSTSAGAMAAFAFVPGFPATIFLGVGAILFALSRLAAKNPNLAASMTDKKPAAAPAPVEAPSPAGPEAVLNAMVLDALEIEIGYGLTRLADTRAGGDLPDRVAATRRQIALELGYVMPTVRIRDNALLAPNEYVIKVRGEEVARSEAQPDQLLAIDSGNTMAPLTGVRTKEPVFRLDAIWIDPPIRETAERNGYTVVEPSAMIATHLNEIVKMYAAEILSRQDVQVLVENTKQANEAVVMELQPAGLALGDAQKVLQHLLRERVPIRDMVTILETMVDFAGRVKDMEQMGELVRAAIARTITRQLLDENGKLICITLEPTLERTLQDSIQHTAGGVQLAADPILQQQVVQSLQTKAEAAMAEGQQPIVLCGTQVRLPLRKLLERNSVGLAVLAYNEVSAQAEVEFLSQIEMPIAA